jgi:hypothetical protein
VRGAPPACEPPQALAEADDVRLEDRLDRRAPFGLGEPARPSGEPAAFRVELRTPAVERLLPLLELLEPLGKLALAGSEDRLPVGELGLLQLERSPALLQLRLGRGERNLALEEHSRRRREGSLSLYEPSVLRRERPLAHGEPGTRIRQPSLPLFERHRLRFEPLLLGTHVRLGYRHLPFGELGLSPVEGPGPLDEPRRLGVQLGPPRRELLEAPPLGLDELRQLAVELLSTCRELGRPAGNRLAIPCVMAGVGQALLELAKPGCLGLGCRGGRGEAKLALGQLPLAALEVALVAGWGPSLARAREPAQPTALELTLEPPVRRLELVFAALCPLGRVAQGLLHGGDLATGGRLDPVALGRKVALELLQPPVVFLQRLDGRLGVEIIGHNTMIGTG